MVKARQKIVRLGATLTEVLTVIVIILILAGITYPVFQQNRVYSRNVITSNSLHQNFLAIQLYQERDSSSLLPYGLTDTSLFTIRTKNELWADDYSLLTEPARLADLLKPFIKEPSLFRSPRAGVDPVLAEIFGENFFGWRYDEQRAIHGIGPNYSPDTAVWMCEPWDYDDPGNGRGLVGCLYETGSTKMVRRGECLLGMRDLALE
jgi:Tfp pilus assembly protein PilE